jgi:Ferritin-like domain
LADEPALSATIAAFDRDGALVEAEQAVRSTRRGMFAGAAAGAVLVALGRTSAARASGASKHDIAILNYALGLEYIQASFYTEAERLGALHGSLAQQATVVGSHERAHVTAFREVLGASAIKRPTFNFRGVTEDPDAFRRTAVAFEDLAVAAYKYQAPRLQSPAYLAAAVAVHSVEARHAAWIRRLAGVLPAASAFDQPLPPSQVEALVASTHFVVAAPHMAAHSRPRTTG